MDKVFTLILIIGVNTLYLLLTIGISILMSKNSDCDVWYRAYILGGIYFMIVMALYLVKQGII